MKRHRIFETICAGLAFMGPVATAGTVDDYFEEGVLGLKWGATLPQVQERFPGGVTYPTTEHDGTYVAYHVPVESKGIGIELPPSRAVFEFTKSETLRQVRFYFSYADRGAVLYLVAEAIGQNYWIRDYELSPLYTRNTWNTVYAWKPGRNSSVALSISRFPHSWVFLQVKADDDYQRQRP